MAPRNDTIAAMVRSELTRNPQIDNAALLEQAKQIDPRVRKLSARQFHATYRLPVVRALGRADASAKPARAAAPASAASAPTTPTTAATVPAAAAPSAPATPAAKPAATSAPATPTDAPRPRRGRPPKAAAAPATPSASTAPGASAAPAPAPAARLSSAGARANAAEREAVRQLLHSVAREALGTEDRASFVRLLDSLDERANVIVGLFRRG